MLVLFFAAGIASSLLLNPTPAAAVWNAPSCNPDLVGPTDPTCNVSAPLNVSAAGQAKAGELTIQNTINAGRLILDNSLGGTGTITVSSNSGRSLNISHGDVTQSAIFVKASTTALPIVDVTQQSTGKGLSVTTSAGSGAGIAVTQANAAAAGVEITAPGTAARATLNAANAVALDVSAASVSGTTGVKMALGSSAYGIDITDAGNNSTGFRFRTTGATVVGLDVEATSRAARLVGATAVDNGAVYGENTSTGAGGYFQGSSGYGLEGHTDFSSSYGGRLCWRIGTNCALFGGSVYAGALQGRTLVTSSTVSVQPLLEVNHANTSASPGIGVQVYQAGVGQALTPITAPQGTAVSAQAVDEYAFFGYSEEGDAAYLRTDAGAAGLVVENLNTSFGPSKYGIQTSATTTQGVGIQATSNLGIAGQFNTAQGVGIQANSDPGIAGLFNAASGGTGVQVNASGGIGVNVNVTGGATAVDTNSGPILAEGSNRGGQFYPNDAGSGGVAKNTRPHVIEEVTIGSAINDMVFDGSDIWVVDISNTMYRINAATGRLLGSFTLGSIDNKLVVVGRYVYAYGMEPATPFNNRWSRIDPLGNEVVASGTLNTTGKSFRTVEYDGVSAWVGVANEVYINTPGLSGMGLVNALPPSIGVVDDIIFANNKVYAPAYARDTILQIDPDWPGVEQEIAVGDGPRGMVYDGQFLWVANYAGNTLSRVDLNTLDTTTVTGTWRPYYLAFDGTNIWYTSYTSSSDQLRSYNVATESVNLNDRVSTGLRPVQVEFDGTNLWVVRTYSGSGGAHSVLKIAAGTGYGPQAQPVFHGMMMYGQNGDLYCVYVNTSGVLTLSTSSFTQCQN